MDVTNLLYRIYAKPGNCLGLLTKKQCVHIATEIGKDLVDIRRSGQEVTREVIDEVLRQRIPNKKLPNIATNKDEYIAAGIKNGYSEPSMAASFQEFVDQKLLACQSQCIDGIYVPIEKYQHPLQMSIVAHEMEHFLHSNHTVFKKFQKFMSELTKKFHQKKQHITPEAQNAYIMQKGTEASYLFHSLEDDLHRLFGVTDEGGVKLLKGKINAPKDYVDFYANAKSFSGLTNEKRLNAYIRAILRHHFHPKNIDNIKYLTPLKLHLAEEARAYEVSDKTILYALNTEKGVHTNLGLLSDIYARASQILSDEIKICVLQHGVVEDLAKQGKPIRRYSTALPTSSYNDKITH